MTGWEFEEVEPVEVPSKSEAKRRFRVIFAVATIALMITGPVLNYYYEDAWEYFLAIAMAFTIGTNLMIAVVTTQVEDKADRMEEKMETVIGELASASEVVGEFNRQLAGPVTNMFNSIEDGKTEFGPILQKLGDVTWEEIGIIVREAIKFGERVDMEKLTVMAKPFLLEEKIQPILDDPFNEPDFYPPPPPEAY